MRDINGLRNCPPIKRILDNVVPEVDLKNQPFEMFDWFDVTRANTLHALANVILFLEGEPLINYNPETGVTEDPRVHVSEEVKALSEAIRTAFTSEKRTLEEKQ